MKGMTMERKITQDLIAWKNNPRRKPLILDGARQVGKTYTVSAFGSSEYEDFVYFNLEKSTKAAEIFDGNINPERIVGLLSALVNKQIKPGSTLLFLDEIQAAGRALTSLKYFQEDAPEYHVVAAGSLLGIAVSRKKISYPVGKVDMMTLYPMDFEEFCWALEKRRLSEAIRENYESMQSFSLHDVALDLYRHYLIVGGMPEAVSAFALNEDYSSINIIQDSIMDSYIADITKYAEASETVKILEAYNSLPRQLLKENRKFQYSKIRSGARANQYLYPLAWLEAAKITLSCKQITDGFKPIMAFENPDAFKLYMSDVGLLSAKFEANPYDIIEESLTATLFKGSLAENYIAQHLVCSGHQPKYWGAPPYAEVDFVITNKNGSVVPIEVKPGTNVRSKSLTIFREKYDTDYSIRFSAKNFGYENSIKSLPLYAAFCLES